MVVVSSVNEHLKMVVRVVWFGQRWLGEETLGLVVVETYDLAGALGLWQKLKGAGAAWMMGAEAEAEVLGLRGTVDVEMTQGGDLELVVAESETLVVDEAEAGDLH